MRDRWSLCRPKLWRKSSDQHFSGRDGRIRTGDLSVPNAARCQTAPRPVAPTCYSLPEPSNQGLCPTHTVFISPGRWASSGGRTSGPSGSLHAWTIVYAGPMELNELQDLMDRTYGHRDRARGLPASIAWLTEEIGELAQALRKGDRDQQLQEF